MSRDARHVAALALLSLVVLTAAVAMRLFVAPAIAPRINVRWAAGVSEEARAAAEQGLRLTNGELREGRTWAYDLADVSRANVRALVAHPAVEDTHYVNRALGTVWRNAPRGSARVGGVLNGLRDSAVVSWAATGGATTAVVAALWLVTTGRSARRQTTPN